jgi:hypothetical protein
LVDSIATPATSSYGRSISAKLFAKQRRNDFSAEAIAAALESEHYPVELVAELLAELKADGDYDRIIAEAA